MNQFSEIKLSRGKVAACSVLALVLGLLQPLALILQVMMPMPGVCIAMVAATVLYAGAGVIPATVFGLCAMLSVLLVFGWQPTLLFALLWVAPTHILIHGMHKKQPFFGQLLRGIVVAVSAAALAVIGLVLFYGQDVIARAIDQLRGTFSSQEDLFWELLQPMLQTSIDALSKDAFVEAYYEMFNMLQAYYEYYLLANLLSGTAISAMLSALWGNWMMARRGEATRESLRGLGEWFLPHNATIGILLTVIVSRLLTMTSLAGAETAWIVVSSLAALAFAVQCLAALDRRMKANGDRTGHRIAMLTLLVVCGSMMGSALLGMDLLNVLAIAGCASALFGRRGAAKPLIQKIKDNMNGEGR